MSEVVGFQADGTPVPLSTIATVSNLAWSTGWKNGQAAGCQQASWEMDLPLRATHPALTPGRRVEVWDGATRPFAGVLTEPGRGEPWQLAAKGLGRVGSDFLCLTGTGVTSSIPDTVIDAAVARGLPWRRYDSLSTSPYSSSSSTADLNRVDALLDACMAEQQKTWAVWGDGLVTAAPDPTSPKWVLTPGSAVMGTADDEFATHVYGRYVTGVSPYGEPTSWATAVAGDDAAAARWGRREYPLDLTALGVMTAPRASLLAAGRLAQAGSRIGFISAIEASTTTLTHVGGAPANLSQVRGGDMLRIFGILDSLGNMAVMGAVDIVIGQTDYEAGAPTIKISPVGLVPRSLADVLAAPTPPDAPFSG